MPSGIVNDGFVAALRSLKFKLIYIRIPGHASSAALMWSESDGPGLNVSCFWIVTFVCMNDDDRMWKEKKKVDSK